MSVVGILIGFYGYLFPGNINLMILNLYHQKKYFCLAATTFIVLLFESLYCFFTLYFFSKINIEQNILQHLKTTAYILTMLMGIWMLLEKKEEKPTSKHTTYRGILSAIIHPQQIPFWLFIGVLFQNIIYVETNKLSLLSFVFFNAIGTLLILSLYAFGGNKLMTKLKIKMYQINKLMGAIYIIIGCILLLKN